MPAVIFDLFGTLVRLTRDTHPYWKLCRATNSERRLRESQIVNAPTLPGFCDYLGVAHPSNIADLQRELDDDIASAALFHDALPTLSELHKRGIQMALISNLAAPYKRAFQTLDLARFFACVVFSCDVGLSKPNPEIYKLALDGLDSDASNVIMVGDKRRADVDGPKSCDIRGFLIDRNSHSIDDFVLRDLNEVTTLVAS